MARAPARIIAVGGARDGVGKTTFAVNAAMSLRKETQASVLIVEADQDGAGDVAALLGIKAARGIAELAPYLDKLDTQTMSRQISVHATGVGFLPLAVDPAAARGIDPEAFARLFELVRPLCDFVVVDCGADVNQLNVKMMEQSSGVFLMASPDVLVLNHTRRLVERLQSLHFPAQLIKVILNRFDASTGIPLEMITQKLQRPVLVTLMQDDPVCQLGSMHAQPFVAHQPRAAITRNYDEFVIKLLESKTLESMGQMQRPKGITIEGGRMTGLDAESSRQAAQIGQWMKSRGSKARRGRKTIDPRTALKMVIHKRLVEVIDLKKLNKELDESEEKESALRKQAYTAVCRLMDDEGRSITDRHERERIVKEILDEALGLGPLEDLLANDSITEIMVNRRDQTYIELKGKLVEVDANFTDDAQLLGVIERIVHPIGRRIDEKSPMVDARLPDGSRVNAIIPPLSLDGPALTIRKFSKDPLTVRNLIEFGSITEEMADLLRSCVEAKLNILISGGTGSGKTTLLNVLSSFIPEDERIVTVEDSAELQLKQPHVVRLESRPANIEGEGAINIRDLVKNCLRMRPDRIVVGECRGAEALDMLQAMNTGHDGSLTTIHANTPRDCISRLETLVMFTGLELPSKAIREQIANAIHIIVQQARMLDGTRKVTKIAEITGMEGPTITLQDIFVFKQEGMDENRKVVGRYVATGFVPKFITRLEAMGIALPKGIFAEVQANAAPGYGPRGGGRTPPGRR
jgi:pilus assembly protein CpaF